MRFMISKSTYEALQTCLGGRKLLVGGGIDERGVGVLLNHEVGLDAVVLDIAPRRRQIPCRRDFERSLIGKRKDALHHALAERARPDQRCEMIVRSAPAVISEALAVYLLTSTTSGCKPPMASPNASSLVRW